MRIEKYKIRKALITVGVIFIFLYPLPKIISYTPIGMKGFANILKSGTVDSVRNYMNMFHINPNMTFPDNLYHEGTFIINDRRNPLNVALENRSSDVVAFLVERGALIDNKRTRINAVDFIGCSYLIRQIFIMDLAEKYGQHPDYSPVFRCFDKPHFTDHPDFNNYMERVGKSLAANAESQLFELRESQINVNSLTLLLDNGFLLCEKGQRNLHNATFYSDPESIKILLDAGCDPNERRHSDRTSFLGLALVYNKNIEVARVLLEGGADPNPPGEISQTPLYFLDSQYRWERRFPEPSKWLERRQLLLDNGAIEYLSNQELQNLYELKLN